MFKISKLLKPEQRKKLQSMTDKINALYALSDIELGRQLTELSKVAWQDVENHYADTPDRIRSHKNSYLGAFIHELIPDIAARLGYQDPDRHISKEQETRLRLQSDRYTASGHYFRCVAGRIINNTPDNALPYNHTDTPTALEILTRDVANGNPVAFALDRCAKPVEPVTKEDTLAWYVREISMARGLDAQYCWTPDMQKYRDPDDLDENTLDDDQSQEALRP